MNNSINRKRVALVLSAVIWAFAPYHATSHAQNEASIRAMKQMSKLPIAYSADAFVDLQWNNAQPPVTAFVNPPRYVNHRNGLTLAWISLVGSAGVWFYTIETKVDDGDWELFDGYYTRNSIRIDYPYDTHTAKKQAWRVWATDNAGNTEPVPTSGGNVAEVLFYDQVYIGRFTDNRGVPLANVTLTASNNVPISVSTNIAGDYFLPFTRISTAPVHTVTVSKPGYAPGQPFSSASATYYPPTYNDDYLYGSDNVISNGHFEIGTSGWITNGNVDVVKAGVANNARPYISIRQNGSFSQQVTIPANMHKPTLTLYRSAYPVPIISQGRNDNDQLFDGLFHLRVMDESSVIVKDFSGTCMNGIESFDMQQWLGKTITVSLEFSGTYVVPNAILADVSLSSWNTPVPTLVNPSRIATIAPGTTITITGDNFIAPVQVRAGNTPLQNVQWINEQTLVATLPTNLSIGRHDVIVTNAGGQEQTLAAAISVGFESYMPLVGRWFQ